MKLGKLRFRRAQDTEVKRWTPVPYKPRRQRSWKDPGTLIPIIISTVALVVSGLSYWDQHQSDEATANAQEESAARLVSPVWNTAGTELTIQNLSNTEIANVEIDFNLFGPARDGFSGEVVAMADVYLMYPIPPCSSVTISQEANDIRSELKQTVGESFATTDVDKQKLRQNKDYGYGSAATLINFTDAQGREWNENEEGQLIKPSLNNSPIRYFTPGQLFRSGVTKPNGCQ